MAGDITPYIARITSEHGDKPKFNSTVGITCQPFADLIALLQSVPALYDLDLAVGQQLDVVGQWVGITRNLAVPLTGVYFAFDTAGVGFDEGVWMGPFDPASGLVTLPDEYFRLLIAMDVLNNHWNGSKEEAYAIANAVLVPLGFRVFIEDPADLTMRLGLIGAGSPPALVKALLTHGDLEIKPLGVHISAYIYQSASGPIFAFDLNNAYFAGFDTGSWATVVLN